jgi:uncharacterized protein (TIGR03437 family)
MCIARAALAQVNVATANYDHRRSNSNPNETILTQAAVSGGTFGKVKSLAVDGEIYAQPLFAGGVQIGAIAKNVVYVATMNDSVYAFDADARAATAPLWQVSLGTPVPGAALEGFVDIPLTVGVLSTPAIDPAGKVLYLVAETFENSAPVFRLHGLSLVDGHEMANGPAVIAASTAGAGAAAVNGTIAFDPFWHLQRPGLTVANGAVYVAFGSHGDAGNYHGWLIAYSASNLKQQLAVFNTTPNGEGGGIWQSGRAPAVDAAGNIYIASGNGDFDGITNFGGAVIKLSGANLSVLDWYTPADWEYLDANDLDVGSTGPILAPDGSVVLAGDKGGRLIYLNPGAMGHVESAPGASDFEASDAGIFGLALWQSTQGLLLYEHDWNGLLKSYQVAGATISSTPVSQGTWKGDSLYHGMAVSSNGGTEGIVWETVGDHSQPGVPGTLHAWNASDLTQELWNSDMQPGDALGGFAKFVAPLVANGCVFVPTFSNQLVVYGLAANGGALTGPQITSILNGASFIEDVVAPGEVLAIAGTNLGPSALQPLQITDAGSVASELSGTQVLFDGIAAPLLYTSSGEVGVVVPFGVAGPTTQIVVQSGGQQSAPASSSVAAANPAIFSVSGLGSGQASILNQDGSVNSANNPAAAGSTISIFATGLGQTNPQGQDGAITSGTPPTVTLPVSVFIGGLQSTVVYAGAAPGEVQGIYQINARVPPLAPSGATILISLQVGHAVSPSNIWLAIQ